MKAKEKLAEKIAVKFGTIKRARNCFLYTEKGVRLTDLYQEEGRAILGWGAKGTFTVLKNVLERGITGSYYTDFSTRNLKSKSRLSKAVSELFASERTGFIFRSKSSALTAALSISQQGTAFFMPWNQADQDWKSIDCLVFAPSFPWADSYYILAVKSSLLDAKAEFENEAEVPSPVCAALTRSVYDLIKALQEREEKDWFIYDKVVTRYWERKGPYLYPKIPEERYEEFINHCLDCELVISPDYHTPSIIPFGADKGVFRKLEKNPYDAD